MPFTSLAECQSLLHRMLRVASCDLTLRDRREIFHPQCYTKQSQLTGEADYLLQQWDVAQSPSFIYELNSARVSGACNIAMLGCQGENSAEKLQVAKNVYENQPLFAIGLGDTFYPHGVSHPIHERFVTDFYDYYSKEPSGITTPWEMRPFLQVLGNHDVNCQNIVEQLLAKLFGATSYDRMMAQILRTYLHSKVSLNWVMPNQYYALNLEHANIFFLNSSFLAFDLVQKEWLVETYQALNKPDTQQKWNIVAMHHPLQSCGKRYIGSNEYDINYYHQTEFATAIAAYKAIGKNNLNEILYEYFQTLAKRDIKFELFCGAHDHALAKMWQRNDLSQAWQVISGAAGSKKGLQHVKIPELARMKSMDGGGFKTGEDFYISQNGHMQLMITNERQLSCRFHNLDNQVIHKFSLIRTEAGLISCE
jgi:hypothetical protein